MTNEELVQAMLDGGRAAAAGELTGRLRDLENARAMAETANADLCQALDDKNAKLVETERERDDLKAKLAVMVVAAEKQIAASEAKVAAAVAAQSAGVDPAPAKEG